MSKYLPLVYVGLLVLAAILGHLLLPKTITINRTIPLVVTKHETLTVAPKWLADSIDKWKKIKVLTDTVNLVETTYVVKHDTIKPSNLVWPILTTSIDYKLNKALVRTYNASSNEAVASVIYVPGPVTFLGADTSITPRMNFTEWPICPSPSFFNNAKYAVYGAGITLAGMELIDLFKR